MSLKMLERAVGDVSILDCAGRITWDGGYETFRDTIQALVARGATKILLNFGEVSYIDSSGIGEIVSAFTTVHRHGGSIKLFTLTKRVRDLLQITKLYTVYEVFDNEAIALLSFQPGTEYCQCPVCQGRSGPPLVQGTIWPPQKCPGCDARFEVSSAPLSDGSVSIDFVRIGSYESEWIEIRPGSPYTISVVGRLSLFSSYALARALKAVAAPRRALFDFRQTTEIDEAGCAELMRILDRIESGARFAISLEGLSREQGAVFPKSPLVHADRAAAVAAWRDVSDSPPWTTTTVRT